MLAEWTCEIARSLRFLSARLVMQHAKDECDLTFIFLLCDQKLEPSKQSHSATDECMLSSMADL